MTTTTQSILFSYHDAQQFPQSAELQNILEIIPYRVMVGGPRRRCSKGREDFSVEVMFRQTVAGKVLISSVWIRYEPGWKVFRRKILSYGHRVRYCFNVSPII